jgi:hypothetical protein
MANRQEFTLPSGIGISVYKAYFESVNNSSSISTGAIITPGGAGFGQSVSVGGSLQLFNGSNFTALKSAAVSNAIYTLPSSYPSTGTSVLQSDSAGLMSWVPMVATSSGAASGFTTLNSLTAGIQYLSFGYTGTVPAFSSSGSTHTLNIPLAGTGSTGLVSSQAQSFAGIKTFTNAVVISDGTGSTTYTSGALVVSGGVGIGGTLNVQGDLNIQGTFTTINSTTITVADKNIELGVVSSPTDLTAQGGGITLRGATDKSINWYSGVGWSSSESWNLVSGSSYKINGTTVLSSNTLGTGVIFSSIQTAGIITSGTWSATAITALYGGTGLAPSFTVGDILYANTSSTWARLPASSNSGYVLVSAGSGATPTYVNPSTLSTGVASTSTYSYQSGYAITSGTATTSSYSYQSGYGITSGFATTASYSYQSGYGITSGFATTAANINVNNATANSAHPLHFSPTATGSGVAVSSNTTLSYNPSSNILSTSGLAITATTASTSSSTGALTVAGGAGIAGTTYFGNDVTVGNSQTGRLYFSQATLGSAGTTTNPSLMFVGKDNSPITLSVLSDNTLSFEGSSGQLFSINNNLSSGTIFSVNDISGIPIIRANANGTLSMGEFTGSVGVGLSNPSYKLHIAGDTNLSSGYVYRINGTSVLSATTLGTGVTNSSLTSLGIITSGTWSATAITALYGGTGLAPSFAVGDLLYANSSTTWGRLAANSNAGYVLTSAGSGATPTYVAQSTLSVGYATTSGLATTSNYSYQSGYGITSGFATTASYSYQSGYGITAGLATTSANLNVVNAVSGTFYPVLSNTSSSASGIGASVNGLFSFNASNGAFAATSVNISANQSYSVGGNSVLTATSLGTGVTNSSLTAVGTLRTGTWAGTVITSYYGGTGYNSYTKGDLLVGAGNTVVKFPVGNDLTILTADSTSGSGVTWKGLLAPTYGAFGSTTTQPVTAANTTTFVNFNYVYSANNVSIGSGTTTRVYINDTGVFDIQFSTQISLSSGNQPKPIDMWFVVDGVSVPNSNTRQTITGKDQETVLTVNLVQPFVSGQYIQLAYSSPDANIQLGTFTGLTGPTRPDIPSVILTVEPISSILPGSGLAITGLASLNLLTANAQTMVPGTSGVDFNISSVGSVHTFNIPDASTTARGLVTTGSQTLLGSKTFASGVAITSTSGSASTTTGALVVSGGVGIGQTLYTSSSYASSISGVILNNSVVTSGSWAGNTITAYYGATGYSSYTTGDILVGAGNTFIKLNAGSTNYVLTSNGAGTSPSWQAVPASSASSVAVAPTALNQSFFITAVSASSGSGLGLSTITSFVVNPSTGIVSVSGLAVTNTTVSSSTATGALQVAGGVGISGRLSFNQASFGTTGIATNPTMAMIGQTGDPIYMSVLEDNTISFEGSQGQLFSITPNLSTGYIYSVNDITGIPLLRANANANVTANEYAGNFGIGVTNPGYKLHVIGSVGFTSNTPSTSTTTGTLIVGGGVGIGQSLSIGGRLQMFNGSNYTAFVSAASGNTVYILPPSTPSIGSSVLQSDSTGVMSWVPMTATGAASGFTTLNGLTAAIQYFATGYSGTEFNIASSGQTHTFNIPLAGTASTGLVSIGTQSFAGNKTFTGDVLINSSTASTNTSTGALRVNGGLGVSGQLSFGRASFGYTGINYNPSMSFIGNTSSSPITLTVLTDNSLSFEGSSGQLFGIDNNLSSGEIFSVSDISGLPIISASAGQTVSLNEFGGFTKIGNGVLNSGSTTSGTLVVYGGVGITGNAFIGGTTNITNSSASTSTTTGALVITGGVGIGGSIFSSSSYANSLSGVVLNNGSVSLTGTYTQNNSSSTAFTVKDGSNNTKFNIDTISSVVSVSSSTASTNTTTGALVVSGGVGIGGSLYVNSASSISSVILNSGTVYGNLTGIATTSTYAYQSGYAITSGSAAVATTSTYSYQSGYGLTSGLATTSTYAYQSGYAITSGNSSFATTASYSYQSGYGITAGLATTATYAYQSGYGLTSGLATTATYSYQAGYAITSGFATTASYSYQSGYGLTSGFATTASYAYQSGYGLTSGLATTSNYSYQSGYGITAGLATTATYSYQAGYAITSGLATTATYSYQSGYAITSGLATSSASVFINNATVNSYHPLVFTPIVGSSSGAGLSTNSTVSYNPSANYLYTSGLAITASTASTSVNTGALLVNGGVGISGNLSYNSALIGTTGVSSTPTMTFIGANGDPVKLRVLDDSTLAFSGSQGQLFSINPVLNTGYIFSVNDISGVPLLRANADATVSMGEFAGNIGIGLSNPAYKLHVAGSVGFTSSASSTSTTTGALVVTGGVGIGGSLYVASATAISGVTINNGVITGNLTGTATTSTYAATSGLATTATYAYQSGYAITSGSSNTSGFATTASYSYQSGYAITSGSSGFASTATYSYQSGYGLTSGFATTATYAYQSGYAITSGSSSFASTATYAYQSGYGLTSGLATTATYAHQSGYAITSGSSGFASTATYAYQSGYGLTSGFATTANYSYQSGYGLTSGLATTATYAHQSGYAITSGSSSTSGFATTASYSYQSGYGLTSGFADTSTYSYQSGYGLTSGLATTASYAYQSGYGITSGFATTATYAYQSGFAQTATSASTATTATNATNVILSADTTNATRRLIYSTNGVGSTSLYNTSTLFTNPSVSSIGASVFTGSGSINIRPGIDATSGVSIGNSSGTPFVYFDTINGRVGINQSTPLYDLHIVGELSATSKSFVIDHPTKPNMTLRHGSLEGPENGVYVRGKLTNSNMISLPDYWEGLVDEETITVSLTPISRFSKLYVEKIENYVVYIQDAESNPIKCYFIVYGERKDVPKLDVEY